MPPPSFLGAGILRPFRRDQKNDFANAEGLQNVYACGEQVLGTRCEGPNSSGELPWRTEFGSKMYLLRHRAINETTRELARTYGGESLQRWEPRLKVTDVSFESSPKDRTRLFIVLHVVPVQQSDPQNGLKSEKIRFPMT